MRKIIGIIGAGDIGLNLAEVLALKGYDVLIYNRYHEVDSSPSPYWLSKMGKIMDMNDSLQIDNCGKVDLTSNINDLSISNYIVITAGVKRVSSDETREELASKNAKIIDNYLDFIAKNAQIEYIREHTILRGNDIIKLTGASSIKGPAHAVMHMIEEISNNSIVTLAASVWDGSRSIGNLARFESNSFSKLIDAKLDDGEKLMFSKSQKALDIQYKNITKIINDII